jgi:hypothetical protein
MALAILVQLSGAAHAQDNSGRPSLQETLYDGLIGALIGGAIALFLILAGKASKRQKKEMNSSSTPAGEQLKTPSEEREKHV